MVCVLDVHKRTVVALVVDHGGKESRRKLRAGRASMEPFLRTLPAGTPVIMESCYAWEYIHDLALQLGPVDLGLTAGLGLVADDGRDGLLASQRRQQGMEHRALRPWEL